MNNEEPKKKIAQIISEYCCPYGKTHKQLYGDDRMCYSKMNFAECNPITECTDALISAGMGDVKEIKYRVRRAEKALYIACREMAEIIFKNDFDRHAQEYMYGYLKQAEKELAEEGKNGTTDYTDR